ncbi:alpha/beta fold hydrolase [Paenibacillus azoreducens]|uniref:prolyl aminopeptidase n=1 Tax=Paenibacillus azoreducens TaxID=116718 RepID=A0A919Y9E6_9BACL|nr:alpha/beta hydrolase [Paenibacillus azoreducens]GIO46259.1 alpha/beta hydrolase [Paenibacillus azoreducens]
MKNKSEKPIWIEEYVPIGGIEQYLFHSGTSSDNPVLLYLHGGPGSVECLFAHLFQDEIEKIFTIVHWDQRGAGKTLMKNKDKYPTIDLMLQDLFEVIRYLKQKYKKQKIVLLGRSWGSVLGMTFIKRFPNEVAYFIGVAQVISMLENERVGYGKLKELILQVGDRKSLHKLEAIGEYPGEKLVIDNHFLKKCGKIRKLQGKYHLAGKKDLPIMFKVIKSPIFKWSDITALMKGLKANRNVLETFLAGFDLFAEPADYQVPVYFILGDQDWQAPYVIAEKYFGKIQAPRKQLFLLPGAGHRIMLDQTELFTSALSAIRNREENEELKGI